MVPGFRVHPVPLLVTVGPGRPGPDLTLAVSADCEMGAGGYSRKDAPSLPWCPKSSESRELSVTLCSTAAHSAWPTRSGLKTPVEGAADRSCPRCPGQRQTQSSGVRAPGCWVSGQRMHTLADGL